MSTPRTPHASPTPHLDVDTLADLQEGLLDPERVTVVVAHLEDCAECRATRDALERMRGLLSERGARAPDAAPEDVVRRLDDALAAARPQVATASATVTALPTPARSPWRTRALQAAAVFVLVAAVGGIGYGGIKALSGDSSGTQTAASDASGGNAAPEKARGTGRYAITNSGRDYTQKSLVAAVPELLAGSLPPVAKGDLRDSGASTAAPTASGTASPSRPAAAPADPGRLLNGSALAACVANLVNGPVTPLAVDLGRFEGKAATIILLPDPDDPAYVNVYAVQPDCPTGLFLTYERVARP